MARSYLNTLTDFGRLRDELMSQKVEPLPDDEDPADYVSTDIPSPQAAQPTQPPREIPFIKVPTSPAAPTSAPKISQTYAPGLDDLGLQTAQAKAAGASKKAQIGRASAALAGALGGYDPSESNTFWNKAEEQGKQGLQDFQQRRQAADQDLARQSNVMKVQTEADDNDANSVTSKTARELVRKTMAGVADSLGPRFDTMTAAQVKDQFPFLKEVLDTEAKKKVKVASVQELAGIGKILKEQYDTELPENSSIETARLLLTDAEKRYGEKGKNQRFGISSGQRAQMLKLKERGLTDHEIAQAAGVSEAEVAGITDEDPEHQKKLTTHQAETFAERKEAVDNMHRLSSEIEDLYKRNGGKFVPGSPDLALIQQKTAELVPYIVTATGQKTMTVAHQNLANELLSEPQSIANYVHSGRYLGMVKNLMDSAEASYASGLHSVGKRAQQPGEKRGPSAFVPQHAGKVQISNGKETLWVDPGDVPHAEAEGFKRL